MTLKYKSGFLAVTALSIVSCASTTPYRAMDGQYGYADEKLEENHYRITFNGNSSTSRETVENYLLFRAAELTLEKGFDYFVMSTMDTETIRIHDPAPVAYGYYGFGYRRFPYYAFGYPWSYEPEGETRRRYQAIAYIALYKGEKPAIEADAFSAREVYDNLSPKIKRPK